MAVPPGTPFSIMANVAEKFNLTLEELEMAIPQTDDEFCVRPKTLVLKGSKQNLTKAKKAIKEKLKERIKKLAGSK